MLSSIYGKEEIDMIKYRAEIDVNVSGVDSDDVVVFVVIVVKVVVVVIVVVVDDILLAVI